jgi:hypothetical protein
MRILRKSKVVERLDYEENVELGRPKRERGSKV